MGRRPRLVNGTLGRGARGTLPAGTDVHPGGGMTSRELYPEFVARFYDVVYGRLRDGADNEFYLRQALESPGPVLEIGCGTGRLLCAALDRGADVEGVDLSPSMIERLKSKLGPEHGQRLHLADAVRLRLDRRYALILAPFRMLSHVEAVEDQLLLLDGVHQHLLPGGRFIFDVYVPSPRMIADGVRDQLDFDGEYAPGLRLRRFVSAQSDIVSQTTRGRMTFVWDEGGVERRGEWNFTMRFFFRYEIEHLLARSRLKLETLSGDFGGGALVPGSKDLVAICRRGEE